VFEACREKGRDFDRERLASNSIRRYLRNTDSVERLKTFPNRPVIRPASTAERHEEQTT